MFTYAECFAGIGAWGKAIDRVTERHNDKAELKFYFEFDKYASNAFSAIHNISEDLNYWDITNQPTNIPHVDILFYSPPCQTFSIAGKQEGTTVEKGNLFYNALEVIKKSKPKYAVMENVGNLAQKFRKDFMNMLRALEEAGYYSYYPDKPLNSKDYGIPQNRERIFVVSIRKDIYEQGIRFEWPKPFKLDLRLKDMLEDEVGKKYFISEKMVKCLMKERTSYCGRFGTKKGDEIANCIDTKEGQRTTNNYIQVVDTLDIKGNDSIKRVYGTNGISPTITACQGGNQQPKIKTKIYERTPLKFINRNGKQTDGDYAFCVDTTGTGGIKEILPDGKTNIRRLTPLECFRLQGFDDDDYFKAVQSYDAKWKPGASDRQMYIRAGNTITVNVIEEILENLLYQRRQNGIQQNLF